MKKMNTWLVALLTVVTLGFYSIYWFATQRQALLDRPKNTHKIPSWLWLLIPLIIVIVLAIPVLVAVVAIGTFSTVDAYTVAVASAIAIWALILIPIAFTIWWMVFFGKAVDDYTSGRVPRSLSIALFIFIGPLVILFQQFYINRVDDTVKSNKAENLGPTTGFLALAAGAIILSLLSYVPTFANLESDLRETAQVIEETRVEVQKELEKEASF